MQTQLYFWKPAIYKNELQIVLDYFNKTKTFFENIENEAREHGKNLYRNYSGDEDTDYSVVSEWAEEKSIEMYHSLLRMKSNHLHMTISLLYHTWEQQLIKFTISELSHDIDFPKKVLHFGHIQSVFQLHGVSILNTMAWDNIRELKLLTNTIKHGEGGSADKLRKIRPDFFQSEFFSDTDTLEILGSVLLDGNVLKVSENDFINYVNATISFWDEMPERAFADIDLVIEAINK